MSTIIYIPYGNDMYEFWVDQDLNIINIRVSRGNCLAVPVELQFGIESLPEGIEDKLYQEIKKRYEQRRHQRSV